MVLKLMKISGLQPLDLPREATQRYLQAWGIKEIPKVYFDGERNLVVSGNNGVYYLNKLGYKFLFMDFEEIVPDYKLNDWRLVANHFQRKGISSFDDLINYPIKNFSW
jgi:hypothetical protein